MDTPPRHAKSGLLVAIRFLFGMMFASVIGLADLLGVAKELGWQFILAGGALGLSLSFGPEAIKIGNSKVRVPAVAVIFLVAVGSCFVVVRIADGGPCADPEISAQADTKYQFFEVTTLVQCAAKDGRESTVIVTSVEVGSDRHLEYYLKSAPNVAEARQTQTIEVQTVTPPGTRRFFLVELSSDEWIELYSIPERTGNPGTWGPLADNFFKRDSVRVADSGPVVAGERSET